MPCTRPCFSKVTLASCTPVGWRCVPCINLRTARNGCNQPMLAFFLSVCLGSGPGEWFPAASSRGSHPVPGMADEGKRRGQRGNRRLVAPEARRRRVEGTPAGQDASNESQPTTCPAHLCLFLSRERAGGLGMPGTSSRASRQQALARACPPSSQPVQQSYEPSRKNLLEDRWDDWQGWGKTVSPLKKFGRPCTNCLNSRICRRRLPFSSNSRIQECGELHPVNQN